MRADQLRAHHRRERERHEAGNRDRARERDRELAEQPTGVALHESDRQEHGHQHDRGRDHRERDLRRAAASGKQRRLTEVGAALDVLHHHDRVVDDQSDAQHDRKQRQQVDREAECPERGERSHQADRYRDRGDQGRARVAEEQVDHDDHQRDRLEQGREHALDRGVDEHRGVERDEDAHAFRQGLLYLLRGRDRRARDVEAVCGRRLDDAEPEVLHAVAAEIRASLLRGPLDARDVAEPHQVAVLALGERQAREVRRFAVAALHAQREVAVGGLEAAGRQLDVLALERVFDVGDREPAGGERRAVEPDAHRVALPAADPHARDAVERREAVHDVALGVIGQLERVYLRRAHVEPQDHIGIRLRLLDLGRVGLLGQPVHDAADRVAHVVRRRLDVAIDREFDADAALAVAALGLDRLDALDAGQRVLEHLRDPRLDHRSRSARVLDGDGHDRRVDGRQLAQRQARVSDHAEHDQQKAHHGREDRAADRDVGEDHASRRLRQPARRRRARRRAA